MHSQLRHRNQSTNSAQKLMYPTGQIVNPVKNSLPYQNNIHQQTQNIKQQHPHPIVVQQPHIVHPMHGKPPNNLLEKINMQIRHIQMVNRELLKISQSIKHSTNSIHSMSKTMPPQIEQIQNDFHSTLNTLIQNIMEFYTQIDVKIKNLGILVDSQLSKKNPAITQNQINTIIQQTTDAKYQLLSQRIQGLEVSLKETQQNQKKLIQVIQNLMQKYQVIDQPTLIRDSPNLQNQFRRNRIATTNPRNQQFEQNSTRSNKPHSSNANKFQVKQDNKTKSIYQNLYTIQESMINQSQSFPINNLPQSKPQNFAESQPQHFRLRQIQQQAADQVYIKKLYSKAPLSSYQVEAKKSLRPHGSTQYLYQSSSSGHKQQRSTASQASYQQDDKAHRLNFMMGKLNT